MGVLIYLPERPDAARDTADPTRPVAQILFFTGVRYERHADADARGATPNAVQGAATDTPRPRRRRG